MQSFFKYFWEKVILAVVPACFFAFTQYQLNIMHGIVYIVIIDTILGMWVALQYKVFSSHHLSRIFAKVGTYSFAMMSVWILAAIEPDFFGIIFNMIGFFILATEFFSNFEKLALLGFELPGSILAKLNQQFYDFIKLDNGPKKDLAKDILRNRIS